MEAQALLTSNPRGFSQAQLVRSINIIDDPVRDDLDEDRLDDPEADEDLRGDRGILNTVDENLALRVYEEIEFRARALGDSYPFTIHTAGQNWSLVRKQILSETPEGLAHTFYLVGLLISAIKYEYLVLPEGDESLKAMPQLMQIMSVLVAAEYVGGESHWMGWPRPTPEKNFKRALDGFVTRSGIGRVISSNPAYDAAVVKDGTVDLIAWRSFSDGKHGKSVLYGQVASGRNWRSKPLKATWDPYFSGWFQGNGPSAQKMFSMFIPFMQHEDCKPNRNESYDELQAALAEKDERAMGIIFDRLRIAELAPAAFERLASLSDATGIDFADHLKQVQDWLRGFTPHPVASV